MGQVNRTAVVPFTASQMFALVNDVESYPSFLPWCRAAEVERDGAYQVTATLTLALGRLQQSVTTRNTLQPHRRIGMQLVRGPLRTLSGAWRFEEVSTTSCRVSLDLVYEFEGRILRAALDQVFGRLTHGSVDAFKERARLVYGSPWRPGAPG